MEVNFQAGNARNIENQKKRLLKLISQIDARMVSRFGKGSFLPTLNIIASSKDTEQSFLDSYINTKKKNESKTVLVIDEPQWVVRNDKGSPDDPGAFWVAIGGKTQAHELLPVDATEELVQMYRDKGYRLLKVPPAKGYREAFEDNLDQALMDIAGISSSSSTKYISGDRITQAKVDTYQNPFVKDIIEVGNSPDDMLQYANFFDLSRVSAEDLSRPMFIHLDLSLSGDKTGIAGTWITGKQPDIPGQDSAMSLRYKLAFVVSIKAPRGFQVSFEKTRNFIKWLRDQGFAIKGISSDTFNSANLLQELKSDGFNTSILSVDRVNPDKVCLTGDTLIETPHGKVKLKDIVPGDEVYSYNIKTNKKEISTCTNWYETAEVTELIEIVTSTGNTIKCTPDHKILTKRGYIAASQLKDTDEIIIS